MRLTGSFYFAVLYIFYEFCTKPVWLAAVNFCLSGFPSDHLVCGAMGVTYPAFPPSLAELNEFRTKILDPAVFTWVKLGNEDWYRLTEIGTVYRNSIKGTAFEAQRDPIGPDGPVMEYFHMCRLPPCTFTGGSKSQNPVQGRPILHITGVAYSDSADVVSATPALVADVPADIPVVESVSETSWASVPFRSRYWKGGLALGVLLFGAASKAKSQWGQISVRTMLTETSRTMAKFVSDNVILAAVSFENGFFDGFSTSLWEDGPVWFVWLVRVICYVFLIHQCGFWPYVLDFVSVIWRKGCSQIHKRADIPLGKTPSPKLLQWSRLLLLLPQSLEDLLPVRRRLTPMIINV